MAQASDNALEVAEEILKYPKLCSCCRSFTDNLQYYLDQLDKISSYPFLCPFLTI